MNITNKCGPMPLDEKAFSEAVNKDCCVKDLPRSISNNNIESKVIEWRDMRDDEMRLRCGELTKGEIRSIKAILNAIAPKVNNDMPIKA